jgi:hypothetical protein
LDFASYEPKSRFSEVKLISGLDLVSEGTTENIVTFGKKYDINFGSELVASLPAKAGSIMDRGFASKGVYGANGAGQQVFYPANQSELCSQFH